MRQGPERLLRRGADDPSRPISARGPKGHPIIGNLWEAAGDPLAFLTRCQQEYGDFVPLRFGLRRIILLSHPSFIECVLVTQNRNFVKSPLYRLTRPLLGNGLLISEGEFWRRQRRLAQPAFQREQIAAYGDVMVTYSERRLGAWQDGEVRDVHREMMHLALQIVAKALLDADVAGESADVGAAVTAALESADARARSWLSLLP